MTKSKPATYQDYVIKGGQLVGRFEEMYQAFEDPWSQSNSIEVDHPVKEIAIRAVSRLGCKRAIEWGCGFGHFANRLRESAGLTVTGLDISATAIQKAKKTYPDLEFEVGDFSNFEHYLNHKPDLIVMSEITWYVLGDLPAFLEKLRTRFPDTLLLHILTTYPADQQKYGVEYFTDLDGIMRFFGMNYLESGKVTGSSGVSKTYFVGKYGEF